MVTKSPRRAAGCRIISTGSYYGAPVRATDLDAQVGREVLQYGYEYIRVAQPEETVASMAAEASKIALDRAGLSAKKIDQIVVGTTTHLACIPPAANALANHLGARYTQGFDINAACSSFMAATQFARGVIAGGDASYLLLVFAEKPSDAIERREWQDFVMSDAAIAFVVGAADSNDIASPTFITDNSLSYVLTTPSMLQARHGGPWPSFTYTDIERNGLFQARQAPKAFERAAANAGIELSQVRGFAHNQAPHRVLDKIFASSGMPADTQRWGMSPQLGHAGAASLPSGLDYLIADGKVAKGDPIMAYGHGAGVSIGAQVVIAP